MLSSSTSSLLILSAIFGYYINKCEQLEVTITNSIAMSASSAVGRHNKPTILLLICTLGVWEWSARSYDGSELLSRNTNAWDRNGHLYAPKWKNFMDEMQQKKKQQVWYAPLDDVCIKLFSFSSNVWHLTEPVWQHTEAVQLCTRVPYGHSVHG